MRLRRIPQLTMLGVLATIEPGATRQAAEPHAQVGLTITYLANEGVLLSSGSKKVVIDGLLRPYNRWYIVPDDSTRRQLEEARPPFDRVNLVLVTHQHGDHFHPAAVAAHLLANPSASLVAAQQVVDSLQRVLAPGHQLTARLHARRLTFPSRRSEVVAGVRVELLSLPHAGGPDRNEVEHLGFIVELDGKRVLHTGDTGGSEGDFAAFRLDTARIDVALLPLWMVTSEEGQRVIQRWIKPRQVIAIHVPAQNAENAHRDASAAVLGARAFTRSLQHVSVP